MPEQAQPKLYTQDLLHLPEDQWQQPAELESIHDDNMNEARDLQQDYQMDPECEQVIEEHN